jgi:hypothetical protein
MTTCPDSTGKSRYRWPIVTLLLLLVAAYTFAMIKRIRACNELTQRDEMCGLRASLVHWEIGPTADLNKHTIGDVVFGNCPRDISDAIAATSFVSHVRLLGVDFSKQIHVLVSEPLPMSELPGGVMPFSDRVPQSIMASIGPGWGDFVQVASASSPRILRIMLMTPAQYRRYMALAEAKCHYFFGADEGTLLEFSNSNTGGVVVEVRLFKSTIAGWFGKINASCSVVYDGYVMSRRDNTVRRICIAFADEVAEEDARRIAGGILGGLSFSSDKMSTEEWMARVRADVAPLTRREK